jgi:hypothetical protein
MLCSLARPNITVNFTPYSQESAQSHPSHHQPQEPYRPDCPSRNPSGSPENKDSKMNPKNANQPRLASQPFSSNRAHVNHIKTIHLHKIEVRKTPRARLCMRTWTAVSMHARCCTTVYSASYNRALEWTAHLTVAYGPCEDDEVLLLWRGRVDAGRLCDLVWWLIVHAGGYASGHGPR